MTDLKSMTHEQLVAMVQAMQARQPKCTLKVTEKGAVSMYGLGRFPVTLYGSQWEKLLTAAEDIKTFLVANADKLSVKGAVKPAKPTSLADYQAQRAASGHSV